MSLLLVSQGQTVISASSFSKWITGARRSGPTRSVDVAPPALSVLLMRRLTALEQFGACQRDSQPADVALPTAPVAKNSVLPTRAHGSAKFAGAGPVRIELQSTGRSTAPG